MPLFHVHGLLAGFLAPLFAGGSVIVIAQFSASEFWNNFITYGANWYTAVPTIHQILLRKPVRSFSAISLLSIHLALVSKKVIRGYCSPAPSLHLSTVFADCVESFSLRQNSLRFVSFGHARLPYLQKLFMSSSKLSTPQCWRLMQ